VVAKGTPIIFEISKVGYDECLAVTLKKRLSAPAAKKNEVLELDELDLLIQKGVAVGTKSQSQKRKSRLGPNAKLSGSNDSVEKDCLSIVFDCTGK
jgi:hypothetical protein